MAQFFIIIKVRRMKKPAKGSHAQSLPACDDSHQFLLIGKPNLFVKENITVNFSPVKALEMQEGPSQLKSYSIIPRFNLDGKYYSQAFSTEFEGVQGDSKLRSEHKSKLKQLSTQIQSQNILLPKPRTSRVCLVCMREYEDYLEHISSTIHQKRLKKSAYVRYISELIDKVRPHTTKILQKTKKIIKKQ